LAKLREEKTDGFLSRFLLQNFDVVTTYKERLKQAQDRMRGLVKSPRIQDTFDIFAFGAQIISEFAGVPLPDLKATAVEIMERASSTFRTDDTPATVLDHWMQMLNNLVLDGVLVEGQHYAVDKGMLYIHTAYACSAAINYNRKRGETSLALEHTVVMRQLREATEDPDSYVVDHDRRKRLISGNYRCAVVNLNKVDILLGIPADSWSRLPGGKTNVKPTAE
jgi:hypothetical protein